MEMATTHQPLLATHIQPLGSGAMMYPGNRSSAWQPVVTMPSMVEVPKESIIANTDFTTTSVIAKRRLSSKKRRMQHQNDSTGSDMATSESCGQSPTNGSPAVTSTLCSPPACEKNDMDISTQNRLSALPPVQNSLNSSHSSHSTIITSSSMSSSSSSSNGVQYRGSGQFISIAPTAIPSTHAVGLMHDPTMLSQLQQGLNYRFLQEQSLLHQQQQQQQQQQQAVRISAMPSSQIAHPQPVTETVQKPSSHQNVHAETARSDFKWCTAHIRIANQIQHHKQHQNGGSSFPIYQTSSNSSFSSPATNPLLSQNHHTPPCPPIAPSSLSLITSSTSSKPPLQQQQTTSTAVTNTPPMPHPHLLMQYNLPPSNAAPGPGLPPGYLAIPYSSVQELQLRMQQSMLPVPTHVQLSGGIPMVKPVMTMSSSLIGLNPGGGVQVMSGVPLPPQAQLAHVAMGGQSNAAVVQGPSAVGSWVTPVPIMNSCVINNPFQPGIMAAPWVK